MESCETLAGICLSPRILPSAQTALLLTVILLSTSLLWLVPTPTAENSTSITLRRWAFKHTNETYTTPAGIEYPVLYVGETFHLRGQFDDANGMAWQTPASTYTSTAIINQPFGPIEPTKTVVSIGSAGRRTVVLTWISWTHQRPNGWFLHRPGGLRAHHQRHRRL